MAERSGAFAATPPRAVRHELGLERREETLDHRVIPTVAAPTHARDPTWAAGRRREPGARECQPPPALVPHPPGGRRPAVGSWCPFNACRDGNGAAPPPAAPGEPVPGGAPVGSVPAPAWLRSSTQSPAGRRDPAPPRDTASP